MPYIRIIHNSNHHSHEIVEDECEGCGETFTDNSRSTKRCDTCKKNKKKEVADGQTVRRREERNKK